MEKFEKSLRFLLRVIPHLIFASVHCHNVSRGEIMRHINVLLCLYIFLKQYHLSLPRIGMGGIVFYNDLMN